VHERAHHFAGLGAGEVVALPQVTAERPQLRELTRRLDSFGGNAQTERMAETHDGCDDRGVFLALTEPVDERPVDLQRMDRQGLQVRERRLTGTEVVDRDLDAESAQPRQDPADALGVVHEHPLGDLQNQRLGRETRLGQRVFHRADELGDKLTRRDVHRDHEWGFVLRFRGPARRLRARLVQYPRADRNDETGVLGDAEERIGAEQAPLRVFPAQQRLEPDHFGLVEAHERLVVHAHLVAAERKPQITLDFESFQRASAHGFVEHLDRGTPAALRIGRGGVGVAHQPVRPVVGSVRQRDTDAGGEEHVARVEGEGIVEDALHAFGDGSHLVDLLDAVTYDRQLVAAEAGDAVAGAQDTFDPAGDDGQQRVAGVVAEAVVDDLEFVEVDEYQTHERPAPGPQERVGECLDELDAVRKVGQRVVARVVRERRLDALLLGHVARNADQVRTHPGRVEQGRAVDYEAAAAAIGIRLEPDNRSGDDGAHEMLDVRGQRRVREHRGGRSAELLVWRPTDDVEIRLVGEHELEAIVADGDGKRGLRQMFENFEPRRVHPM